MARARILQCIKDWYTNYQHHRTATADLRGCSTKVLIQKGTPQGGVFSPILRKISFDELLLLFDGTSTKALGYADDASLMVCGRDPYTIIQLLQSSLNKALAWGHRNGLTFATSKNKVVIFTTKYKYKFTKLSMNGTDLPFSSEVKYLGIILDSHLTFKAHLTMQESNNAPNGG